MSTSKEELTQEELLVVVSAAHQGVAHLAETVAKLPTGQGSPTLFVDAKKQGEKQHNNSVLHKTKDDIANLREELNASNSLTEGLQTSSSSTSTAR